jgi:hypothetical protein
LPPAFVDRAVGIEDIDQINLIRLSLMPLPDGIVVGIVSGRHFHHAGAEFRIDENVIGDDRNQPIVSGRRRFADGPIPARVLRMHGHGRVAEHRFGARGGDDHESDVLPRIVPCVPSISFDRIADVPEARLDRLVINLVVADAGLQVDVPVDQPFAAVDQAVFEEFEERLAHGAGAHFVQREARAVPVAGAAEAFELFEDAVAVLLLPFPDSLAPVPRGRHRGGFCFPFP